MFRAIITSFLFLCAGCGVPPSAHVTNSSTVISDQGSEVPFFTGTYKYLYPPYISRPVELRIVKSEDEIVSILDAHWGGKRNVVIPAPSIGEQQRSEFNNSVGLIFLHPVRTEKSHARITSVLEKGDKLLVRTTVWELPSTNPEEFLSFHLAFIPKTDKKVTFDATTYDVLEDGEFAKWKAMANPLLPKEHMEEGFLDSLDGMPIKSYTFEMKSLKWVKDNLGRELSVARNWTMDSDVWVGVAYGDSRHSQEPPDVARASSASATSFSTATAVYSIEDGLELMFDLRY